MEAASLKSALQRHWIAAWATFVAVALLALAAAFLPQERYEATTLVSVQPAQGQDGVTAQLLSYLIPSLEARVSGSSLRADVENAMPSDLQAADWVVSTSVPAGSGVLRITVNSETPELPVAAANAYAQILANEDLGTERLQVLVIDPASDARGTSSRMTILVSGLALGAILAPLVALARASWGRRPDRTPPAAPVAARRPRAQVEPARQPHEVR